MGELERIKLNIEEKKRLYNAAKHEYNKAEAELKQFQSKCPHANATIKEGYQGGGIYYASCTCPDCGRSGTRYIPEYHMAMNNRWYSNPEYHITLERAINIGKRIGGSLFESNKWWGLVDNYQDLLVRSGMTK